MREFYFSDSLKLRSWSLIGKVLYLILRHLYFNNISDLFKATKSDKNLVKLTVKHTVRFKVRHGFLSYFYHLIVHDLEFTS